MSGFSPDWLSLRGGADARARSQGLLNKLQQSCMDMSPFRVVDIGTGAGAAVGALAPLLPAHQHWRLVDDDPALLELAADNALAAGLNAEPFQCDLASDLSAALDGPVDLVTAFAFFDLTSADWIARFVEAIAVSRPILYAPLIYDGAETWSPPHPADDEVLAAFHAHQMTDKGFGPSAGPKAAAALADRLEQAGYGVSLAPSPWRLDHRDAELIAALADGSAAAARETGLVHEDRLSDWRDARIRAERVSISHTDLLAIPHKL